MIFHCHSKNISSRMRIIDLNIGKFTVKYIINKYPYCTKLWFNDVLHNLILTFVELVFCLVNEIFSFASNLLSTATAFSKTNIIRRKEGRITLFNFPFWLEVFHDSIICSLLFLSLPFHKESKCLLDIFCLKIWENSPAFSLWMLTHESECTQQSQGCQGVLSTVQ